MPELAKTYDPVGTEARWQQAWEDQGGHEEMVEHRVPTSSSLLTDDEDDRLENRDNTNDIFKT